MPHNPAAMRAAIAVAVSNCLGRYKDLNGRDLNTDRRYGYQCMDLWNWYRTYVLGFGDILPTPDAASVWELNNQPGLRLWKFFDAVLPSRPAMPGDVGIMNRQFFGNGVGHIFLVLQDLGSSIEVLELNGLGDGFEDDAGGQHGSPARTHTWPKTNLYGYLRWIGPTPDTGTIKPAGATNNNTDTKEWYLMTKIPTDNLLQIQNALMSKAFGSWIQKTVMNATAPSSDGRNWALKSHLKGTAARTVQLVKDVAAVRGELAAVRVIAEQAAQASGAAIDQVAVQNAARAGAAEALAEAEKLDAQLIAEAVVDEQAARLSGETGE